MLRGWTTPGWALVGGLLAVIEFGPLSQWMNSYWGGAICGIAGCLVIGSLPRRNGFLLGLGLGLQILSRPFEALLLLLAVALYFVVGWRQWRGALFVALGVAPALALTLVQNRVV